MDALFRINEMIFALFSKFFRFLLITLLWIVCSIPLFTLGAATSALNYAAQKLIQGDDSKLVQKFFNAFKLNFRQGTALTLIYAVLMALLYFDFVVCFQLPEAMVSTMLAFVTLVAFMMVIFMQYSFALLARYNNTIMQNLKNAFFLSFLKFGRSVLILFFTLLPVAAFLFFTETFFVTLPIWLLIVMPVIVWINTKIFSEAFRSFKMIS